MVTVHPAFDLETKTWFTDEGVEAPSLRELQEKLGARVKIKGYVVVPTACGMVKKLPPALPVLPPPPWGVPTYTPKRRVVVHAPAPPVVPPKPKPAPTPRIAQRAVGLSRQRSPVLIIARHERIPWTPERLKKLATLARKGASATQIAMVLGGVSRNAVIGKAGRQGVKLGGGVRNVRVLEVGE